MAFSPFRPVWRAHRSVAFVALMALTACQGEGGDVRKQIAGDYVREIDGRPTTQFYARQVLTLRADGSWIRTTQIETAGYPRESPPDSGTYRIEGVKVALRSLIEPGALPVRYTLSGDSLVSANAAQTHALTGHDIGEEVLVRAP
jgi:hypothetical protein